MAMSKNAALIGLCVVLLALLQVEGDKSGGRIIVIYKKEQYDVTKFADFHPGGRDVLEKMNGKDVEQYLLGKQGVKLGKHLVQHKHSDHVFNDVLPQFLVKKL